jgi:hypothetical protein
MSIVQAYLEEGMALVAIRLGQKGPVSTAWNKLDNVITDPEQASGLTGNIGLAHAYCLPVPTMALDLDDIARAEPWLAARGIDVHALLEAEDAVQIISGKAGRALADKEELLAEAQRRVDAASAIRGGQS